jgi:hypothetical protein
MRDLSVVGYTGWVLLVLSPLLVWSGTCHSPTVAAAAAAAAAVHGASVPLDVDFDGSSLFDTSRPTTVQTLQQHIAVAITTDSIDNHFIERVQRSRFGTKRLLAVRVSNLAGGGSSVRPEVPDETRDEIEAAIFGTGANNPHGIANDDATLCAQYLAVSHGQLVYTAAAVVELTSPGVRTLESSGVMEISINLTTMLDTAQNGTYFSDVVKPAILARLEAVLQQSMSSLVADHVLLCLPTGTLRHGAAAMGDIAGMYTYYHYGSCAQLPILMHELGHNLNFYHADVAGREYADLAGYMGGPQAPLSWRQRLFQKPSLRGGYPRKAFDGHHHWASKWFANGAVTVEPALFGGSALYRLTSFVDYSLPSNVTSTKPVVLIRVGASLYIQYNRAKGYNRDTPVPNRVTITQAWSDLENASRVAALAAGEVHVQRNYTTADDNTASSTTSTGSVALVIQVCSMVRAPVGTMDYADISIHVDDGVHTSSCPPGQPLRRRRRRRSTGNDDGTTPVTAPQLILGALSVADPVRTVFGIVILLCALVLCCLCVDACCLVYLWGCRSRACALLLGSEHQPTMVMAESKVPPSCNQNDDDDTSLNGTTVAGSTGTSEAEEFA